MANGAKYPTHVPDRFEIRQGKFGPYFYDLEREADMPLEVVLDTLNRYSLRKQQLKFYVEKFGEMNTATAPDAAAIRREVVEECAKEAYMQVMRMLDKESGKIVRDAIRALAAGKGV